MTNLSFRIGNEFLDLLPGTILELEEENPFLQTRNEIKGQYSIPFAVPLTDRNVRLLKYANVLNIVKDITGIEAIAYSKGIQHSRGRIKIETGTCNLSHLKKGTISCYYLYGISDFYKDIEGKYLTDMNFGPDQQIGLGPVDRGAGGYYSGMFNNNDPNLFFGYWNNLLRTGNPDSNELAIFPVINEAEPGDSGETAYPYVILNSVGIENDTQQSTLLFRSYKWATRKGRICPFFYLDRILKKVFNHVGWHIQGDIFEDADFKHIVLLHNNPIDYYGQITHLTNSIIRWNPRDFVPKIKMSSFLIGLQNRFGWWYDFDFKKKVCTIKYRNSIFSNRQKRDITSLVGATYNFKNNNAPINYSLTQSTGTEKPDFSAFNFQGVVTNPFLLPTPTAARINHLYFVLADNSYYFCSNSNGPDEWIKSTDNNFDFAPFEESESISTGCLVPGHQFLPVVNGAGFNDTGRWSVVPAISLSGYEEDTFYIAYHHGMGLTINNTGLPDRLFPISSASCHDTRGIPLRQKALVYEYNDGFIDRGLHKNAWAYFLSLLSQKEEITLPVRFTLPDVLNMQYTDTLVIRNVEYFIKNPHFTLPIQEYSNMELIRIR